METIEQMRARYERVEREAVAANAARGKLRRELDQREIDEFQCSTPDEIGEAVATIVALLDRPGWPENGRASHHGWRVPGLHGVRCSIVANNNACAQRLLVTIYSTSQFGHQTKAGHLARADAVAKALGSPVFDTWNGGDGMEGISVVFGREAPESLFQAIGNALRDNGLGYDKKGVEAFRHWVGAGP
ncbi:hypothetical protein [uncultured Planktomarina sp.]|uniref:hypothetical protein n=1 Tax=uncultured Planktomarina sp. TaxID=1538529 RepID=UPI00325FF515